MDSKDLMSHYTEEGGLGADALTLPDLKDIFVKEDPFELNRKMELVQKEKMDVLRAMIQVGGIVAKNRGILHKYLRSNYKMAIANTKKNAGMEALELWAGAQDEEVGLAYDLYVHYKEKYHTMDKIRMSLESDLSGLQSRSNIFKEIK